ncbi:MAG: 8-amino-7-oxononanoate synthase [Flavobacteriales bacterium]|nr:8-amino-7-oxononanoate synthase [Flavobacteriales bacterium]
MNRPMRLPYHIQLRLEEREKENSFRMLGSIPPECTDFSSNDYLGLAQNKEVNQLAKQILVDSKVTLHGATGSRLISGNHILYEQTESLLADLHQAEGCLIYPSGYMANLGLLSAIPQRGDTILYDALCHASIRDGIRLSLAHTHSFQHNNLQDLEKKIKRSRGQVYVVTESVFSMDGDEANIQALVNICETYQAYLIVDEAHSLGVQGWGKVQQTNLHQRVFARVVTFGKAMGAHGAAVLGSWELIKYLINFSRPFIYTTGMPPAALATIQAAYRYLQGHPELQQLLAQKISFYKQKAHAFETTSTPIQRIIEPGNVAVRALASFLHQQGYYVKPILSPTVPAGTERIRICLHAQHTEQEIAGLIESIHQWRERYS